jgi:glycine/D-amino acid oxidase-like deaminating enzyme
VAISKEFDVLVAGAGPAGFGAAVAAARAGSATALIERHVIPGGMGTAALVNNFCPAHLDGTRLIIGGIFGELRRRLITRRALYSAADDASSIGEYYAPEIFAEEMNAMLREAGVRCFYGLRVEGGEFSSDVSELRFSDGQRLTTRTVVDATGDATVAALAGTPFRFGRATDGAVMPLTFCFSMGPVDLAELKRDFPDCVRHDQRLGEEYCCLIGCPELDQSVRTARQRKEISIPLDRIPGAVSIPGRPEIVTVNFGRVECKDPTDPLQLASASKTGLRQIEEAVKFLRRTVPGFGGAALLETARQIGVRQSRQIDGLYELTAEDCLSCRQFDDVIAQCSYSLDIHEPGSDAITLIRFAPGTHYDIPWRCLIPKSGPENLVVAGRSISASTEAMSSFRVSPSCMAIGEAAGVTAALACKDEVPVRAVDWRRVQSSLATSGAILN